MKTPLGKLSLSVLVFGLCGASSPQAPAATLCGVDGQVDAPKRQVINSAAVNFFQTILGSTPSAAYGLLSDAGKHEIPNEQTVEQVGRAIQDYKPTNLKVLHTYIINIVGESQRRVICGTDLSKPDNWVSVAAADLPEQAYVLLSAEAINNQLAFIVWLVPSAGGWKVQSFSIYPATVGDEGPDRLLERARVEKARRHDFNAALLYAAAIQTTNRGPNFQLGLADSIAKEGAQYQLPPEISGQPPFEWKSADMMFKVLNVGPIAIGGKIYVVIQDESPPWSTSAQIDGWNRKLIAYFKSRFPEYSDVFAGIVVRANEEGTHRGFGTVDDVPSPVK